MTADAVRACAGQGVMFDAYDETPEAEWNCKALCFRCPVLYRCREWAVRTDVHGVAGALNPEQREEWRRYTGMTLATDTAPERDLRPHRTAAQIADQLGVCVRTVVRYRARQRTLTPESTRKAQS
jgi:hypothetical protein